MRPSSPEVLRFAVCTFDRVFDTDPKQETLTLPQLVTALLRFELKPELLVRVDRTLGQIERAWEAWEAGSYRSGKQYGVLRKAADTAKRDGKDANEAARVAYEHLKTDARGAPKRDLRLWAPTLYRPGGRRTRDDVVHLSCLVLDYDKGLAFDEAQAPWLDWFHIAHSTWSHTPEKPKFRIILPLAGPVAASEWRTVWDWAFGITGDWIDHAMKGIAVTFALPSSPSHDAVKIAVLNDQAPLLDPVAEGIVRRFADMPPIVSEIDRPASHFNGGVQGHTYQELAPIQPIEEPPDTLDVSGEWEVAREPDPLTAAREAVRPEPPAPAPSEPREEEPAWDERSDEWETLFDDL
ncbi:MAG: hypothetical protein KDA24_00200 [Deltaproteobacteria bacterium]|nr:hypothetical protein [Deltaproteobacteria bacterium]